MFDGYARCGITAATCTQPEKKMLHWRQKEPASGEWMRRRERERAVKHKKLQLRKSIKYIKMKNECLFYAKFSILWVLVLSGELRVHFFVLQGINENEVKLWGEFCPLQWVFSIILIIFSNFYCSQLIY